MKSKSKTFKTVVCWLGFALELSNRAQVAVKDASQVEDVIDAIMVTSCGRITSADKTVKLEL